MSGEEIWTDARLDADSKVHDTEWSTTVLPGIFNKTIDLDKCGLGSAGMNSLHFAAIHVDVPLLHEAVRLGAALDFPSMEGHSSGYPPGLTPLHIAIMSLATFPPIWRDQRGVAHAEAKAKRCMAFIETLLRYG